MRGPLCLWSAAASAGHSVRFEPNAHRVVAIDVTIVLIALRTTVIVVLLLSIARLGSVKTTRELRGPVR